MTLTKYKKNSGDEIVRISFCYIALGPVVNSHFREERVEREIRREEGKEKEGRK